MTAKTEEDIAADFVGFFKNFQDIFGIKNFKIYVTGESYAGRYVPYISAAMLDKNDTTNFDLKGRTYFATLRIASQITDTLEQVLSSTIQSSATSPTLRKKSWLLHM